jgi:hypothetical protein
MSTGERSALHGLDDCGCCSGVGARTPQQVLNRPGLAAVAYRTGTYSSFRASMLARLTSADLPALADLKTRDQDDFTIALLDSWAVVGDVLTFYQERIANESFLRTATERRSLLELARLIGYPLRPGVAASTFLAFTLEQAPGAPQLAAAIVEVAAGTRVQSLPGQDETPQTFETSETIEGRVAWNAMRPQRSRRQQLAAGARELFLAGAQTQLKVGDAILIVGNERLTTPASLRWDFRVLQSVTPDEALGRTRVTWARGLAQAPQQLVESDVRVYALRQRASLFGHNAPDPDTLNLPATAPVTGGEWDGYVLSGDIVDLDSVYPKIVADSWLVLTAPGLNPALFRVQNVAETSRRSFALNSKVTRVDLDQTPNAAVFELPLTAVYAQSDELEMSEVPVGPTLYGDQITLDRRVEGLEPGQRLAVRGARLRLALAGTATGLQLVPAEGSPVALDPEDELELVATPVLVIVPGVWELALDPAGLAAVLALSAIQLLYLRFFFPFLSIRWAVRDRDGVEGELTALEQVSLVGAPKEAERVSEIVAIDDDKGAVTHDRDRTTLRLATSLAHLYDRHAVTINANVAAANHGETVTEVLGAGDASRTYQTFALKQTPLTYVSAATASGALSTLEVRVNDILWHEVPTLYGRGSDERVFVTRRDDDGGTLVQFGDGKTGARLPTGQDNVRATYRKGIGRGGLVVAERLTQLMSRPLGLKEVTNPRPSENAEDPEDRDQARANAPLTVLTLGRTVSLQDYEDFTRAFAGIAKAHAAWVLDGDGPGVFITVAGPDGAALSPGSQTYADLLDALAAAGDPHARIRVASYRPAFFRFGGRVRLDPDYLAELVLPAVEAALRAAFAFDARRFGQPVTLGEVIEVIHGVPGVVAVDVDALYRDPAVPLAPRLLAELPYVDGAGETQAAELLTLDPAPLDKLEAIP